MAGSPRKRQEREALVTQIDELSMELAELRRKVAASAPHLLNQDEDIEERFGSVTADNQEELCKRIDAMAKQGMTESQMIAALGMTEKEWGEGRNGFSTDRDWETEPKRSSMSSS